MCIRAVEWAIKVKIANVHAKLVLIVLASHASRETMEAFPSVGTLAEECGLSRRSVYRALSHLEKQELLSWQSRRWANGTMRSAVFTLVPPASQSAPNRHDPVPLASYPRATLGTA
jgi:DNA-binding transcriptional MocR family regulator